MPELKIQTIIQISKKVPYWVAHFLAKIHNVCNILQQSGELKPKRAVKPVLDVGKSLKSDDL